MGIFEQSGALTSFAGCCMSLVLEVPEGKDIELALIESVRWEPKGRGSQGCLVLAEVLDTSLMDDYILPSIRMSVLWIENTGEHIDVAFIDDIVLEGDIRTGEVIHFTGSKIR